MLGSFLELGVATTQIRESFQFYQQLGFAPAITGDIWSHPYGVLVHDALALALHAELEGAPALTFVKADVAQLARELERRDLDLHTQRLGVDSFNEIGFTAPGGAEVRVLEARTFSPPSSAPAAAGPLGRFLEVSLPVSDPEGSAGFWSALGYPVHEDGEPWPRQVVVLGGMRFALHRRTLFAKPLLLFGARSLAKSQERYADFSVASRRPGLRLTDLPHAVLEAPEGTLLLVHEMPARHLH